MPEPDPCLKTQDTSLWCHIRTAIILFRVQVIGAVICVGLNRKTGFGFRKNTANIRKQVI